MGLEREGLGLATNPDENRRDGQKAVEAATEACRLSEWKVGHLIGTLAAAHAEAGDFLKAIELQEKAISLYAAEDDKRKGEQRLALYKAGKPYREE